MRTSTTESGPHADSLSVAREGGKKLLEWRGPAEQLGSQLSPLQEGLLELPLRGVERLELVVHGPVAGAALRRNHGRIRSRTSEHALRVRQALHLRLALLHAHVEGAGDPVAVRLQRLEQVVRRSLRVSFVLQHRLDARDIAHLTSDVLVKRHLLLLQGRQRRLALRAQLLVRRHVLRLVLAGVLHLVLDILLDHGEDRDHAAALALAPLVVPAEGLRGRVLVRLVLRLLEQRLAVKAVQRLDRLADEHHRVGIVLEGLLESLGLLDPRVLGVLHGLLDVRHLRLRRLDLRLELRLLVLGALLLLAELLLVVLEVLVLRVRRRLLGLAPVLVLDVRLLLLAKRRDHLVDVRDHRVEVPARRHSGRNGREAQGGRLHRHGLQDVEGLLASRLRGLVRDLEEHRPVRRLEDGLGLLRREDGESLVDGRELLSTGAGAARPLVGLRLAARLGLLEEGLVRLELRLGLLALLRVLRELLLVVALRDLRLRQRLLQERQVLALRLHKARVGLRRRGLLLRARLQLRLEVVLHLRKDALDLARLRGVGAGGRVRTRLHQGRVRAAEEGLQRADVALVHVLLAQAVVLDERGAHAGHDSQELRLRLRIAVRVRLEEVRRGVHGRLGQHLDRLLEVRQAELEGRLLLQVLLGFLLALRLRLLDRLLRLADVLLELLDLRHVAPEAALELQDALAQLVDELLRVLNGGRLAGGGLLAPARVLVVDLLLSRAVRDDLRLQAFDQLDNPLHGVLMTLLLVGSHACHKEHEEIHDTHCSRASSRFVSNRSARPAGLTSLSQ